MSKKQCSILNFVQQSKCSKRPHSPSLEEIVENVAVPTRTSNSVIVKTSSTSLASGSGIGEISSHAMDIGGFLNKKLSDSDKHNILTKCWVPDDMFKFPLGMRNLKFQKNWLQEFHWLSYSKVEGGAFCRYCFVFAKDKEVGKGHHVKLGAFVLSPFTKWKDAKEEFRRHEASKYHNDCSVTAQNFLRVHDGKSDDICTQIDSGRKEEAMKNRQKLVPIVKTVMFCGKQEIALRGHLDSGPMKSMGGDEDKSFVNDGNFRALLRFRIDSGDDVLKTHLDTCNVNSSYISPHIQNEIIETCGNLITSEIVKKINDSGSFSILADETTDISGVEQFTLCARYTEVKQDGKINLREDFLKFVPVHDTRGEALAQRIIEELKSLGVNLSFLKGQGYDGASAMSGQYKGCAAVIKKTYPEALYVHCSNHALNLALTHACSVPALRNSLATMKEIINFFRMSPKRSEVLKEIILSNDPSAQRTRLIKFCETRWVEHLSAMVSFRELFIPILKALSEIQNFNDADTASKAFILFNALNNSQFLIAVATVSKVFYLAFGLCKFLQNTSLDLAEAVNYVETFTAEIQAMRDNSELEFNVIFKDVESIAKEIGMDICMPRITGKQTTRPNYKTSEPKEYFRLTLFIPFMDFLLQEMKDRFLAHKGVLESMSGLLPKNCVDLTDERLRLCCESMSEQWPNDLCDAFQLEGEMKLWKRSWLSSKKIEIPKDFVSSMNSCNKQMFPSVFKALKIAATLPITTATAERSFSTLRRLKSYLRSTTSQNRLNGLAHLSIHREIEVTPDQVLDVMAKKPRKLSISI